MNIALMSHDNKKELMVQFCTAYAGILSHHNIYATNTTGHMVADATGLNVLSDFCHQCREHGSTLLVCGVQPQPLDVIRHAPFYRELKRYNICENIDAALNRARKIINGPAPKHL